MHSREHLWHALAEAAELEHNLLCSYLFAAFSLKQDVSEDLTPSELRAVTGWRNTLMGICIEEMVHLAQVSNLLVAVGARAHFNRPNLPVAPGYHPASIVIELAPFDLATMEHFIFLERPEDAPVADPPVFEQDTPQPDRDTSATWLMPSAPPYATVGEFYRYVRTGLAELAVQLGEQKLFCGSSDHQLRAEELSAPELKVVTELRSAQAAIDFIVEQGEGSPTTQQSSHFQRFSDIRDECMRLTSERPGFQGHRPVARNPVMHPPTATDRTHVTATAAAEVLDAANAMYNVMLRSLVEIYEVRWNAQPYRDALLGVAFACMKALTFLASKLTRLPAQDGRGVTAGISFATLRSTEGFAVGSGSAGMLAERLRQIGQRLSELEVGEGTQDIETALAKAASVLAGTTIGLKS
jgi:hypothetical protein